MNLATLRENLSILGLVLRKPIVTGKVAVQTVAFIRNNNFEVRDEHFGPIGTLAEGMNNLLEQQRRNSEARFRMVESGLRMANRIIGRTLSEVVDRNLQLVGDVEDLLAELKEVKKPNGSTKKAIRRLEEIIAQPGLPVDEVPADEGGVADVEADAAAEEAAADA